MNRTPRRLTVLAVVAALALVAALPASSSSHDSTTTVSLTSITGSRTLSVTDTAGATLNAGTVSMAAGATVPFVTNVTDVLYKNEPYTVTAQLSNLYLYDATGDVYDCAVYIPSGDLSITWPTEAFGLQDISALVDDVVYNVSGTLPAATGTLDTLLASVGLTSGTSPVSGALSRDAQGVSQVTAAGTTLASSVVDADLPLKITVGAAGAFSAPVAHSGCTGSGDPSPTPRVLQQGADNSAGFSLSDVGADIDAALGTVNGAITAGHFSEDEVLDEIFTDAQLTTILTAVAADPLVLGPAWDAYVDSIMTALGLDTVTAGALIGQTGTYASVPALQVASSLNVAGTPPPGVVNTYQGEMLVTLMPEPTWP